jgi:hypothetical protein
MPWVRLSTWRDMRAREERVEALLEQWDSNVAAARSDSCKFSGAFEVLGTCAGELHEALDGDCDEDCDDED